jgi:hypothetical protein
VSQVLSVSGNVAGKPILAVNRAATLRGWYLFNSGQATAYVQFFDAGDAGTPNVGGALPDLSLGIPAGAGANLAGHLRDFRSGIVIVCTTTRAGNGAPAVGVDFNLLYC